MQGEEHQNQQSGPEMSPGQTKVILGEMLGRLNIPENDNVVRQIRDDSRNDAMAFVQMMLPFVCKIQQDVLARHSLDPTVHGINMFMQYVRVFEREDRDILSMAQKLKSYILPPAMS